MNDTPKHSDQNFEANLRSLLKTTPRPEEPTADQVDRWVQVAQSRRPASRSVVARFFRSGRWGVLASTAAAAAVLIVVTVFAIRVASPSPVSADDIFAQIRATLAQRPVVRFRIEQFRHGGHVLDADLHATDNGSSFYGAMQIDAIDPDAPAQLGANLQIARDGSKGWVLIRRLECNGNPLLEGVIPSGGGLLVKYPVSEGADLAMREAFPMMFSLDSIGPVIESLQGAVTDLNVFRGEDGVVRLSGVISDPAAIDLEAMDQALNMVHVPRRISLSQNSHGDPAESVRSVKRAAGIARTLAGNLESEFREESLKQIDLLAEIAEARLLEQKSEEARQRFRKHERLLRQQWREKLAGARIHMSYDSHRKALTSMRLENLGSRGATVAIDFQQSDFDRSRLDSQRFADQKNIRSVYRNQLLVYMLMPSFMKNQLDSSTNSMQRE